MAREMMDKTSSGAGTGRLSTVASIVHVCATMFLLGAYIQSPPAQVPGAMNAAPAFDEANHHRRQASTPTPTTPTTPLMTPTLDELAAEVVMLKRRLNNIPQGPAGPRGPRGYRGVPGETGARGGNGNAGNAGADGANGYCAIIDATGEVNTPCPELRDAANANELNRVKTIVDALTRQIIVSEVGKEERVRYEGASGLALARAYDGGSKAYHETSYTNTAFANFHNHANLRHTMGMGEVVAVLNGVQFATRHNDYNLAMPDPTIRPGVNADYGKTAYVDTPLVPPQVLAYRSVADQAEEMRRWFHAWTDQDPTCPSCRELDRRRIANNQTAFDPFPAGTRRWYPDYFKPVLCVMEGAWIGSSTDLNQAFGSDRHFTDANNFRELYDKNRYLYQSGRKTTLENLPFLPLSIRGLAGITTDPNNTDPAFASWEYRIVCTPVGKDIPLNRFKIKSDLAVQLGNPNGVMSSEQLRMSRQGRFDLNLRNQSSWVEGRQGYAFIDDLMYLMPGKDGYGANLYDDSFGTNATSVTNGSQVLNTARYTRYYATGGNDAMGRSVQRRSFSDPTMWAAMTTMPRVQGVTSCSAENLNGLTAAQCNATNTKTQKWTWAVPLEIIFTTPLTEWNPYNLSYCPDQTSMSRCAYTIEGPMRARNGGLDVDTAYNGTARDTWFATPSEFFESNSIDTDAADTSGSVTGVLDRNGTVRRTRAAGHWIFFPPIVGFNETIRQRYPIMPIHEHGTTAWKELKALQDILMSSGASESLSAAFNGVLQESRGVTLLLQYTSGVSGSGPHSHTVSVTGDQLRQMDASPSGIVLSSSLDNGHQHDVRINRQRFAIRDGIPMYRYQLLQCDEAVSGAPRMCGNTSGYPANRAALRAAVGALRPWGFYTETNTNFIETNVGATLGTGFAWRDISGNNRHATQMGKDRTNFNAEHPAPYQYNYNRENPGVLVTNNRGVVFPMGSIPTNFTIFVRAKYIDGPEWTPLVRRIVAHTASTPTWFLGWDSSVGRAQFGSSSLPYASGVGDTTRTTMYNFQTVVGRNQIVDPILLNGVAVPTRVGWTGGIGNLTLAVGASAGNGGSDAIVSDVIIFDYQLTTAQADQVSDFLETVPDRPYPCCWDMHGSVTITSSSSV